MDDAEKIRNFDKLSFEEQCALTGQNIEDFLSDAIPLNTNLTLINCTKFVRAVIQLLKDNDLVKRTRNFEGHLKMLLANLYKAEFLKNRYYIYYSRSPNEYRNIRRYNPLEINFKPLMNVIKALDEIDLVETSVGFYDKKTKSGKRSRIRITMGFEELFSEYLITPSHLHKVPIDPVRMKDKNKKLVNYRETPFTRQMRTTVRAYNKLLSGAEISVPFKNTMVKDYLENNIVDFSNNTYHRIFNDNSFTLGGRFYGPWWQTINSDLRKLIIINKQKTVELDYSSFHIHLVYSKEELNYYSLFGSAADPYILKGYGKQYREIVKNAFLIALNMKTKKNYAQTVSFELRKKGIFKKGIPYKDMLNQFFILHPRIKKYFFTGVGTELQYVDSCITESIVKRMIKMGIPVLGVHDSFIVGHTFEELFREYMHDSFIENNLVSIPIIKVK